LVCAYHVLVFDAVFCSQQISPAVALTSLLLLSAASIYYELQTTLIVAVFYVPVSYKRHPIRLEVNVITS